MSTNVEALQHRTDSKVRYAKVHLEELASLRSLDGSDFDRAHQESFLFHLLGAVNALLIELNHYYGAGLPNEGLSPGKLRDALKQQGKQSEELAALHALDKDETSWLCHARALRDHATHILGAKRAFSVGGPDDGKVQLRNPKTSQLSERHVVEDFNLWLTEMRSLVETSRKSAQDKHGL